MWHACWSTDTDVKLREQEPENITNEQELQKIKTSIKISLRINSDCPIVIEHVLVVFIHSMALHSFAQFH